MKMVSLDALGNGLVPSLQLEAAADDGLLEGSSCSIDAGAWLVKVVGVLDHLN